MTSMNKELLPNSDIWFVRAERKNVLADCFLENGVVAMGWGIGPIASVESQEEIADRLREDFWNERPATLTKWAREIREFNQDMGIGDVVATYEPRERAYHVGIIRALLVQVDIDLLFEYESEYVHQVDWLYQVARDSLSHEYTRSNLDRRSTLHRLSPEASNILRQRCVE